MKKQSVFIIMFAFIGLSASAQVKNDLAWMNIKGNVKTLTEYAYKASGNSGEVQKGDLTYKNITSFNEMGNKIVSNSYKPDGSLNYKILFKYDDKGNKIAYDSYKQDGSLNYKVVNKYDDKGNVIEYNFYKSDGSLNNKIIYKYNDKGNAIEYNSYKPDGSLNYKIINKYDDMGNIIETDSYKPDGSLNYKYTYRYDDKGNEIELKSYKSVDSLNYTTTFKYDFDLNGNWIKRTEFKDNMPQSIREREISDKENIENIEKSTSGVNNIVSTAPGVLLQNKDHVISYNFSGDNIVFTIEDIGDKVNNVNGPYMWDQIPYGKYYQLSNDKITVSVGMEFDGSILEFDSDLNGILNPQDKGFFIQKNYDGTAYPHYLYEKFRDPTWRGSATNAENTLSKANGIAKWKSSTFSSNAHPVFVYTIPLSELLDFEKMKISFRCVFIRAGGERHSNNPPLPTDKYYCYPEGQSYLYSSAKFFTLDFGNSTDPAVVKAKKVYDDEIAKYKSSKKEAGLLRKLYTVEAMKKPITVLPKYDGVFVKLKNGKYLEVNKQKLHYGVLCAASGLSIGGEKNPFYLEAEFDTLRFIQIEKSNFNGFSVVAGNLLKPVVDYMTFHPIRQYPLVPLQGGKYKLVEKEISTNKSLTGTYIENVNIYWFDPKINVNRSLGDSWSYYYTASGLLDPGFYGFWAGKYVWLMEIIPDKVTTTKPVKK